jgi:hypothetical protein
MDGTVADIPRFQSFLVFFVELNVKVTFKYNLNEFQSSNIAPRNENLTGVVVFLGFEHSESRL